ncbi:hypothetical protein DFH06DRAFT_1479144, partial [Mycena polygramma]
MSATLPCSIPAAPDISGVGVRTAIYAQNFLSFIPALWALWDGDMSEYELECVETQSTTILVTAFAILISAMVQVGHGLSNFHAAIVLNLSWMNNTNTFIYFLLYVQHKSQPGPQQITPTFASWINHLRYPLAWRRSNDHNSVDAENNILKTDADEHQVTDPEDTGSCQTTETDSAHSGAQQVALPVRQQSWIIVVFRRIVMVLGSFHLSLMAGLGIWLWSDPQSFASVNPCAIDTARIVILGRSVELGSSGLRAWSIAIYSFFLVPGLNLILPMALFLGLFLSYQEWNGTRTSRMDAPSSMPSISRIQSAIRAWFHRLSPNPGRNRILGRIRAWYDRLPATPSILPTVVGMLLLFAINLIFLVDIEFTLR